MAETISPIIFLAVIICLLVIATIQSRRIDSVHRRISLTTKLNGLKDPWRDADEKTNIKPDPTHDR